MEFKNEEVVQNLELQLSELEMLNSMFPNDGELELADPGVISDIQDYLQGKLDISELSKLQYTVNLNVQGAKVAACVSLPVMYPEKTADVSVHSPSNLSRSSHDLINNDLKNLLGTYEPGMLAVGSVLEWIQDNLSNYTSDETLACAEGTSKEKKTAANYRMWIQSHHIYNKHKISDLQNWAEELCLNGFIMPGKPGFVCVEGMETNCQMWWQRVRALTWQRITLKLEEKNCDRKFSCFENVFSLKEGDESNMKSFMKYLEQHNCTYVSKEYFGFEKK